MTKKYFPDDQNIDEKRELLAKTTTIYIKERGGEEGLQIRYGQPVRLENVYWRQPLYYDPTQQGNLLMPYPDKPIPPGAVDATFILRGPDAKTGDGVMTGDPVILEIRAITKVLAAETVKGGDPSRPWRSVMRFHPRAGASGADEKFSLRIRGSGQRIDGMGMPEKRRPLVSGDHVMITGWDDKGFAHLMAVTHINLAKFEGREPKDPLFRDDNGDYSFFVIRNV